MHVEVRPLTQFAHQIGDFLRVLHRDVGLALGGNGRSDSNIVADGRVSDGRARRRTQRRRFRAGRMFSFVFVLLMTEQGVDDSRHEFTR